MRRFMSGVTAVAVLLLLVATLWAALPNSFPRARSYHYSLSVYLNSGQNVANMLYHNVKDGDYNKQDAMRYAGDLTARLEYARRDADSMNADATPEEMKTMQPYIDSLDMHFANISQDLKVINEQLAMATPDRTKLTDYSADLYWQFKDAETNDHKEIMAVRHVKEMEEPPRPPETPSY